MKSVVCRASSCIVVLGLFAAVAHAEVIELEGTIKAIDAEARTVTIERKTPKGVKTLDLEVNKKAGDLSAVKVGDAISFSYDPDLEIVTKIGSQQKDARGQPAPTKVLRLTLEISEEGEAALRLSSIPTPSIKGDRKDLGRRTWEISHSFHREDDADCLKKGVFGATDHIAVNPTASVLEMRPGPTKGYGAPIGAHIFYPVVFSPPVTLQLDFTLEQEGFELDIFPRLANVPGTGRTTFFSVSKAKEAGAYRCFAREMNGDKSRDLFDEAIRADDKLEKKVRLPVPNVKSDIPYLLRISAGPNTSTAAKEPPKSSVANIHGIVLTGRPAPIYGMQLGMVEGKVFVQQVNESSVAQESGVAEGDVLVSVDGTQVKSVDEAMALLRKHTCGEKCTLNVLRGGSRKVIEMTWNLP